MSPLTAPQPHRVVVVGGGFTGACVAVQMLRHSRQPLQITMIDPAERPGRGMAYRTADADHRLNAPSFGHSLLPDDAWHFSRWIVQQRLRETDPASVQPDGSVYVRRSDFGRYLEETLAAHAQLAPQGSALLHRRARAVALAPRGAPLAVQLDDGRWLGAEQVVIATGNGLPRLPPGLPLSLADHPALHADPIGAPRLQAVQRDAAVLLLGSGLTALDQLSTLVRQGHCGPVTVLSRHGLQPRPNVSPQGALAQVRRLEDLDGLAPGAFMQRFAAGPPAWLDLERPTVRRWLCALRQRISQVQAGGGPWQAAFDELRDAVWQLWPRLPPAEQRRFLQRLRPWYDVHRFRSPPPNDALVAGAIASGRVRHQAGRLLSVQADGDALVVRWRPRGGGSERSERVLAFVNCSGLDGGAMLSANPLLASGVAAGRLQAHPCGLGLAVDTSGRAIGADGRPDPALFVLGPPSAGAFGDPLGAVFIGAQVQRLLPALLHSLDPP